MVQFNIPKFCYNAGIIDLIGASVVEEGETLIPPFSAVYVKKSTKGDIEVDLAQDNRFVDFSMSAAY